MPHHLRLNLHLIKNLPRIDSHHTPNHLRNHNHISQMRLHQIRLLIRFRLLFCFAEFLDQAHGTAFETSVEATAGARVDYVAELLGGEIEELIEVDAAVGEFAERALLFELGSSLSVVFFVSHDCGYEGLFIKY